MNKFVKTSIAAAVMVIGSFGAFAQSPGTTGTGSNSSMTPSTPSSRSDVPGTTGTSDKAKRTSQTTKENQANSTPPLTTPTGPKNTPPYGHIEGGQPASGGTSSVNRPTGETQDADSRAKRSIEGETRRGADAAKPTPAERAGTARTGGGSPPMDSPVSKTNPAGGSK